MPTAPLRRPSPHAVSEAGRHLVAAEAMLRGFSAVIKKAGRLAWVEINGRRVEVHTALDDWPLDGERVHPEADLVVFVGRGAGAHEFFVATRAEAIDALDADWQTWLASQPDGQSSRTPKDQQTLRRHVAEPWRDRWELLGG